MTAYQGDLARRAILSILSCAWISLAFDFSVLWTFAVGMMIAVFVDLVFWGKRQ